MQAWKMSSGRGKHEISLGQRLLTRMFHPFGRKEQKQEVLPLDTRRRAFLKYAFFGGAVFLAGKYTSAFVNMFQGDTVLTEKTFKNFKLTETGRQLLVTDDDGGELLIIDKEAL